MASAPGPPISTSQRQEASTTNIGPRAAEFVERRLDLGATDRGRASARARQPRLDGGARGQACGLGPQQLRNADAGLSGASDQARVDVVVEVADLDSLWHPCRLTCNLAQRHARSHLCVGVITRGA